MHAWYTRDHRARPQHLASSCYGAANAERFARVYISSWRAILEQNLFLPLSAWETRCCERIGRAR